ncbi:MAG: Fis family transcriptional regulator, partial [SAR324 cluster bacterium]|nr:Fis family transcriptional regulator [SAR324 cluster bacterium]
NEPYDAIKAYNWPGNIRELENLVERAVIVTSGPILELEVPESTNSVLSTGQSLESIERAHILCILEKTHWKITGKDGAADALQINSSTLRSRMKKLGIKRPESNF